jgi:hypothetical protein
MRQCCLRSLCGPVGQLAHLGLGMGRRRAACVRLRCRQRQSLNLVQFPLHRQNPLPSTAMASTAAPSLPSKCGESCVGSPQANEKRRPAALVNVSFPLFKRGCLGPIGAGSARLAGNVQPVLHTTRRNACEENRGLPWTRKRDEVSELRVRTTLRCLESLDSAPLGSPARAALSLFHRAQLSRRISQFLLFRARPAPAFGDGISTCAPI